jgi:hypothetical protein
MVNEAVFAPDASTIMRLAQSAVARLPASSASICAMS